MRRARWTLMLATVAVAVTIGFSVPAAQAAQVDTPGELVIEAQLHPGPNDPGRCIATIYLQFDAVAGATRYEAYYTILSNGQTTFLAGPPFDDDITIGPFHSVAPPGKHRLSFHTSGSTGAGCQVAIDGFSGVYAFVRAVATVPDAPPDQPPVCSAQSVSTAEDSALDGSTTCTDEAPATVTYQLAASSGPQHGAVAVDASGSWRYTPTADFHGADGFGVLATDGGGHSATQAVAVTVASVDDPPTCAPLSLAATVGTPASVAPSCTDRDGDALTYSIAGQGTRGTAAVGAGPSLRYTATSAGSDSFTYQATGAGVASAAATVSVTATDPSTPPSATGLQVGVSTALVVPATRFTAAAAVASGTVRPVPGATFACGEAVTVALGPLTETIPGSAFRRVGSICSAALARSPGFVKLIVLDLGRGQWSLAGGGSSATFTGFGGPLPVGLAIGDDAGSVSVTLARHGGFWSFPR